MNFNIGGVLPATAPQLWAIFFDVKQVASLIPGCEDVVEIEPLKEFSAVMKQKVGPFKLEVPTRIVVESHTPERQVHLRATGRDKRTATTIDVQMKVDLDDQGSQDSCRLDVDADMQVAGRMATLGYPIIKKKSEELFAEFESRLREKLSGVGGSGGEDLPELASSLNASPSASASASAADPNTTPPAAEPASPSQKRQPREKTSRPAGNGGGVMALSLPRAGVNVLAGIAVAGVAVAFDQSNWWWLAAPLLGIAAAIGKKEN